MKEFSLSGSWSWLRKSIVGRFGKVMGRQAGEQARGESRWMLFALPRCLDVSLKIVRELVKDLN